MARRVTSSRFVGRAVELAELQSALTEAAGRGPSLALVSGESGVGKTRLLTEFTQRARESGARVLSGDSVELGEGELPYGPIVAALRPLVRAGDPAITDLPGAARAELATLVPELGGGEVTEVEDERGAAQRRLFEALLALLERLGQDSPLVLEVEDIHWADRSTRAFLAYLAVTLCSERVLVVATYRSDELHRRHPLRPMLAELERAVQTRRIDLQPLARDDLALLVEDITGERPAESAVERVYRRSEGNPLFAEELLAADQSGRGPLPPTLREALMVRIERLPDATQDVLRLLAAVVRCDHSLLADASGMDPRDLREALREGVSGHIVVVDGEGRYLFRHALLREVVYDDLLPGERADLHLALAGALERRSTDEGDGVWISAGIAHHYRAAGDQAAALRASIQAAAAADRVHAHGEAAALLERALESWDRVPDAASIAEVDHVELLLRAARAHQTQPDDSRAVPLYERALHELDADDDPVRYAGVLGELAAAQWSLGRGDPAWETLEQALALLPDDGPTPERARLLSERVRFLMLRGRYRESIDAARVALAAAEAANDEAVRGLTLNRLGSSLLSVGEAEQGAAALREAIELAHRRGTEADAAMGHVNFADSLHGVGRTREGYEIALAGHREAAPGSRGERWLTLSLSQLAFALGDWEASERYLGGRRARGTGSARVVATLRAVELALGRGDTDDARAQLDESASAIEASVEPQYIGPAAVMRARLERRTGDIEAAEQAIDYGLDRIEFCSEDALRLSQVAAEGVAVVADAAERARDVGDADREQEARMRAESLLERVRAAAGDGSVLIAAYLAEAEAEASRAAGESDPELWAAAVSAWEGLERPYRTAMALWRHAEALVAAGEREAGAEAVERGLGIARDLGSEWLVAELEQLAARGRLGIEAAAAGNGAGEDGAGDEDEDPFGLTERERQVLALLAAGATNRQIGAELYMAEKTASVHVSRILSKLGVRRRTEAAAVAHRHGLDGGDAG